MAGRERPQDRNPLNPPGDIRGWLARHAAWLLEPELGVAAVGTTALHEAGRRAGIATPAPADIDLAWALDVDAGEELLRARGVHRPVTANSRDRGTLACHLGGQRLEITAYRGDAAPGASIDARLSTDLAHRECTVAAVAWLLGEDRIVDPLGGLEHWRAGRLEPCGDVRARVEEHPIRLLRAYRRAFAWGLTLSTAWRRLDFEPRWRAALPGEAVASELRRALLELPSPGRLLLELHEAGILEHVAEELAPQFDGRPAGPQRHHPEHSQALHLILCLEWAVRRTAELPAERRARVLVAVLCHDLGKGLTRPPDLPSHPGHEQAGVPMIGRLLDALPGLTDGPGRRLAEQVAALHLSVRRLPALRPGTLARLYEQHFRAREFPLDDFALAIGADAGGRLGLAATGDEVAAQVHADVRALRAACATVDVRALRAAHADVERFRRELHASRVRAIRASGRFATRPAGEPG